MRYCTICWDAPAQTNSPYCAACGKIQKRISQAKADKAYHERHKPKEERENLGDDVRGIIWGEHVWKKGEVLGTKAMESAFLAGKHLGIR